MSHADLTARERRVARARIAELLALRALQRRRAAEGAPADRNSVRRSTR